MKRFSIVENGYNIDEVNNFIDIVIKKLEVLSADNNNYLMQLEELKKQVAENQVSKVNNNYDEKISKALIAAQETTDKMKELARTEADLIVKEAKDNASAIVHEALVSAQKTEQELDMLKKSYSVYKTKMESLIKGQLSLLEKSNIEE